MLIITQLKKYMTIRKIRKLNIHAENLDESSRACDKAALMYKEVALSLRIEAAALSRHLNKVLNK